MPYVRKALRPEQWPVGDSEAWARANHKTDLLEDPGLAAHWRAKSRHGVEIRYGLWLAFLQDEDLLDPGGSPASRVKTENLGQYVEHLRAQELSPVTVAGRVRDLLEAIRVLEPGVGRAVTGDAESYQYLVESIRKFPRPNVFAGMIRDAGFSRVKWQSLSGGIVALHSGWRL